jgi:threonine dehydrogenase-like Zn-dependent dehydrogenase
VAVLGQGLIGLLVTRILSNMKDVETVTVEVKPCRRQLSRACGATVSLPPEALLKSNYSGVDVAIEVSGNAKALQLAIDCVRPGGKCVIASWYGEGCKLNLGTAFHRSHINIIASQVSSLPAAVSMTWSKDRRFAATWKLIKEMKPGSELFVSSRLQVPLSQSQFAYESLEKGDVAAAIINYDPTTKEVDIANAFGGVEAFSRL